MQNQHGPIQAWSTWQTYDNGAADDVLVCRLHFKAWSLSPWVTPLASSSSLYCKKKKKSHKKIGVKNKWMLLQSSILDCMPSAPKQMYRHAAKCIVCYLEKGKLPDRGGIWDSRPSSTDRAFNHTAGLAVQKFEIPSFLLHVFMQGFWGLTRPIQNWSALSHWIDLVHSTSPF